MPKSESNNTWKKENFSIEVKYDLIPNVARIKGNNKQINSNQNKDVEFKNNNNRGE